MITTHGIFLMDNMNRILLVHATNGRWNQWSIPKGLGDDGETSLNSAMRELAEETNIDIQTLMELHGYEYSALGTCKYKSGNKQLEGHLFKIHSNLSERELNLKCESMVGDTNIPECDQHSWYELSVALDKMHEAQSRLLKEHLKL